MDTKEQMDRCVTPLTAQQHGQQDGGEGRARGSAASSHGWMGALVSVSLRGHLALLWPQAWGRCIAPLPFPTSRMRPVMGRRVGVA